MFDSSLVIIKNGCGSIDVSTADVRVRCVYARVGETLCACLRQCVLVLSLSRLKWINSNHRKHSQKSSRVESPLLHTDSLSFLSALRQLSSTQLSS